MPIVDLGGAVSQITSAGSALVSSGSNVPLAQDSGVNFGVIAQDTNVWPGDVGDGVFNTFAPADSFWVPQAIDAARWDRRFPYQLLVVQVDQASGTYSHNGLWQYTLPIAPESMTISMPFASSVEATMGGVVEENSGAPFRTIALSADPGIVPVRGTAASKLEVPDLQALTGGFFAGTIQAGAQAVQSVSDALGFFQGNLMDQGELATGLKGFSGRGTGYYQFNLLRDFLEGYAALRKSPDGKYQRLAFANWKDQTILVCTPVLFEVRRNKSDPLAYPWSLQLRAWRRIQLQGQPTSLDDYQGKGTSPTLLQQVLNVLTEARGVLEDARDVMQSTLGDVTKIFEPIRQTQLLVADALGVGLTVANMPSAITQAVAAEATFSLASTIQAATDTPQIEEARRQARNAVSAKTLSQVQQSLGSSASPAAKTALAASGSYRVQAQIPLRQLQLSPALQRVVQAEVARSRKTQRIDLENHRAAVQGAYDDFADAVGEGSADYDGAAGRTPRPRQRAATDTDFGILFAMSQTVQELSRLALGGAADNTTVLAVQSVAGLARRSGIAFTTPTAKFAVPMPYGITLEQLALRYLGDPNRWMEIAALNGLREPYIDEQGFDLTLTANGRLNQITVADAGALYLGQAVTLRSSSATPTRRRIVDIDDRVPGVATIYLDGDADLARYTVAAHATLHTYLADTVNSTQQIYMPSAGNAADDLTSIKIPGVDGFSDVVRRGGVDLLVTTAGDAAITPDGDWQLAVGLTNLTQRVRVAFATPRGSLPQHPSFGLGIRIGQSVSDMDARAIMEAARGMFAGDPDFTGVHAVSVNQNGPGLTMSIRIGVGVAGQQELLPLSFSS